MWDILAWAGIVSFVLWLADTAPAVVKDGFMLYAPLWTMYVTAALYGFVTMCAIYNRCTGGYSLLRYALPYGQLKRGDAEEGDDTDNLLIRQTERANYVKAYYADHRRLWNYFESPRTIFLMIVVQSLLWPVDFSWRSLKWLAANIIGAEMRKTLYAVITLRAPKDER